MRKKHGQDREAWWKSEEEDKKINKMRRQNNILAILVVIIIFAVLFNVGGITVKIANILYGIGK